MCLGLPGRLVSVEAGDAMARVELAGVVQRIDVSLLPPPFVPGEYLLVHSGIALQRMSDEIATEALRMFPSAPVTVDDAVRGD